MLVIDCFCLLVSGKQKEPEIIQLAVQTDRSYQRVHGTVKLKRQCHMINREESNMKILGS